MHLDAASIRRARTLTASQIFPAYATDAAMALGVTLNWLANWVVAFTFPLLHASLGPYSFLIFAASTSAFGVFTLWYAARARATPTPIHADTPCHCHLVEAITLSALVPLPVLAFRCAGACPRRARRRQRSCTPSLCSAVALVQLASARCDAPPLARRDDRAAGQVLDGGTWCPLLSRLHNRSNVQVCRRGHALSLAESSCLRATISIGRIRINRQSCSLQVTRAGCSRGGSPRAAVVYVLLSPSVRVVR